jgi:hypothetical protein
LTSVSGTADGVDGHNGPAAGQVPDGGRDVAGCRIDDGRAQCRGTIARHPVRIDGGDLRALGDRDHDRREAHTAAAVHGHAAARLRPALVRYRAVSGGEAAAETRRGVEVERVRQPHPVDVGNVDDDQLGERPPMREPRLLLVVAHLLLAAKAGRASTARADERRRDPIAELPTADLASGLRDDAGELVARDVRQPDVPVMPHPAVPVAAAQPRRLDPDQDGVRRAFGLGHVEDGRRHAEPVEDD